MPVIAAVGTRTTVASAAATTDKTTRSQGYYVKFLEDQFEINSRQSTLTQADG